MTDLNDIELADGIKKAAEEQPDISTEHLQESARRLERQKMEVLATALHAGYDGVDIHSKTQVYTSLKDFKMGFDVDVWEEEPPELERFPRGIERYDFTVLEDWEKRELLAHIGISQLPKELEE